MTHSIKATGADYYAINPKGNVPALILADGTLLNENVATQSWLMAQPFHGSGADIAPAAGTSAFYTAINSIAFTASELHPAVGNALFGAKDEASHARAAAAIAKFEKHILKGDYTGASFSAGDLYPAVVLSWYGLMGHGDKLAAHANAAAFQARVFAQPTMVAAAEATKSYP